MGLSFVRAKEMGVDSDHTSAVARSISRAFNGRIRSGLGDCAWRIAWWFWSFWHDPRNPVFLGPEDYIGSWAPSEEALTTYIHVAPKGASSGDWPDGDKGEEGGPNVMCPPIGYVFGNSFVGYYDEFGRIGGLDVYPVSNASEAWDLAKRQRGAITTSGIQNCPALAAAQSFLPIVYGAVDPTRSKWGGVYDRPRWLQTWGGMMPTPAAVGTCADFAELDYEITITPTVAGLTAQTYSSCLYYVITTPINLYVINRETGLVVATYPRTQYVEGPYSGGAAPGRAAGDQMQRVFQHYCASLRGTEAQRPPGEYNIDSIAFDWDRFLKSQYYLAPQLGHVSGSDVVADYNVHTFTGSYTIPAGSLSTPHSYQTGFVRAGCLIEAASLVGSCTIELLDGPDIIKEVTLTANSAGAFSQLVLFEGDAVKVKWNFQVRMKTDATLSMSSGYVRVEANELLDYKPALHDAFLVARLYTARKEDKDNDGSTFTDSAQASAGWWSAGCLAFASDLYPNQYASENGFVESARQFTRKHIRVFPRTALRGYEVASEGGVSKSVLIFDRYKIVSGTKLDPWEGIVDAVSHEAEPGGETNEWVMVHQACIYSTNEANPAKTDVMADYFSLLDRCQVYDTMSAGDKGWRRHIGWLDSIAWAPQAPSGFRYYPSNNPRGMAYLDPSERPDFYSSCRVYEPPDEVDRVESFTENGGDFVRVVFKARFQHCPSAQSSIDSNPNYWDVTALNNEPYRTTENAIRQYIVRQLLGQECGFKLGDTSAGADVFAVYANTMRGACMPKFWFIHLVPEPYSDGNNDQDDSDMDVTVDSFLQMDAYLAAMCEGFIDGTTTARYACSNEEVTAFDYNYERLCVDAFNDNSIGVLPHTSRPDAPLFHGPLPRTPISAEVVNRFSKAINLLTKARIWLPVTMQVKQAQYTGQSSVGIDAICGPVSCGDNLISVSAAPPNPSTLVAADDTWLDADNINISSSCSLYGQPSDGTTAGTVCDGSSAILYSQRVRTQYRFVATDGDLLNSLPPLIRAMVDLGQVGMVCRYYQLDQWETWSGWVSDANEATQCCLESDTPPCPVASCGLTYGLWDVHHNEVNSCGLFVAGTLDPGTPPAGDYYRKDAGKLCVNASLREMSLTPVSSANSYFLAADLVEDDAE